MSPEYAELKRQQRAEHTIKFLEAVNRGDIHPLDVCPIETSLKKGDYILWRNSYRLLISPNRILGFSSDGKMYIDTDSYWAPFPLERAVKVVSED